MSPFDFVAVADTKKTRVWRVLEEGYLNATSPATLHGVRPAISLKAGTTAISGDGTASNPYVIE